MPEILLFHCLLKNDFPDTRPSISLTCLSLVDDDLNQPVYDRGEEEAGPGQAGDGEIMDG